MMNLENDISYINRILDGETACYSYLVDKYNKRIYSFIFKILRNREDAQEICQDVFIKAFRSLSSFKMESSFSTWIYRIAYNTTISTTRKKKREYLFIDETQLANISEDDVTAVMEQNSKEEQLVCLEVALLKLPPEERSLIMLFYTKEKSIKDVALITGLSPTNIKTRLHRIRKKIFVIIKTGEIDYE